MTTIHSYEQIRRVTDSHDFTAAIEAGFVAYSDGLAVVPSVGELTFQDPPGDTHIKYGYIRAADHFVIKIASGFYQNPKLGLPSSSGLMLVFSRHTGLVDTILLDQGYLTDLRTALAGRIAARYLAPTKVAAIGIFGTGIQARMQVEALLPITPCRRVIAWGRNQENLEQYAVEMSSKGFSVTTTLDAEAVCDQCNLLITATPATSPLIRRAWLQPGTHITAMGADTPGKQELDSDIPGHCDLVVADSISQCLERGEIARAVAAGLLNPDRLCELGDIIAGRRPGRHQADQITMADLTGVAVQDICIATEVCKALASAPPSTAKEAHP